MIKMTRVKGKRGRLITAGGLVLLLCGMPADAAEKEEVEQSESHDPPDAPLPCFC